MASYYFPHNYNARTDPKLQEVLMTHGVAGIGVYWCLVEQLYEEDNCISLRSCKCIAFALHADYKMVESIINDFGLFQNDGEIFWSDAISGRLEARKKVSEQRTKAIQARWEKYKTDTNVSKTDTNVCDSDTNVIQNYTNKRKEKESKYKEKEINKEREIPSHSFCSDLVCKVEDLRNDVYRLHSDWVEVFCMNNHIRLTDFRIWMDEFTRTLQNRDERKTMQDFKAHFASWFKIQYDHVKEKQGKTKHYDDAKSEMEQSGQAIRERWNKANSEKITYEQYQELKKRAEAGDAEAKKKLGI